MSIPVVGKLVLVLVTHGFGGVSAAEYQCPLFLGSPSFGTSR